MDLQDLNQTAPTVAPFDPSTLNGFHLLFGDAAGALKLVETIVSQLENLQEELHALHPCDPGDEHGRSLVDDLSGCTAVWRVLTLISDVARGE